MKQLISILDDEPDILELVEIHIKKAGFDIKTFSNSKSFYSSLNSNFIPDLLILDLMLPDTDGFDVVKYLRNSKNYTFPIIMLTAKGDEIDKILGLEIGADDYIVKPFSPRELVARVKAVLRRKEKKDETKKIVIGDSLIFDLQKYEVKVKDNKIKLNNTEFKILSLLAQKPGWVFTREQILDYLWGNEKFVIDRTIDVHIKHLREKIGDEDCKFIKNIRGIGYKIVSENSDIL